MWQYRQSSRADDTLTHHGVSGQTWGVRRWQNEDGSYTEAGKIHYGIGDGRENSGNSSQNKSSTASSGQQKTVTINPKSFTKDEQTIYKGMTAAERKAVDARMLKGESVEQAIRNVAKDQLRNDLLKPILKRGGALLGTSAAMVGAAAVIPNPVAKLILGSYGMGAAIGTLTVGTIGVGVYFIEKSQISKTKLSDAAAYIDEYNKSHAKS